METAILEEKSKQETPEAKSPKKRVRERLDDLFEKGHADWEHRVAKPFSDRSDSISIEFHRNSGIFFDEIARIVETNRVKDEEKTMAFLRKIREVFLSYSPCITNYLSTDEMIVTTAKINHIEELRGLVGQEMVGEFVYNLSFEEPQIVSTLINTIESLPPGLREETINQLETAFANAYTNGEWAETAAQRIEFIIRNFLDSENPITRIVAKVALERLEKEKESPSLGVLTYADNKSAGRLDSKVKTETVSDKFLSNLPFGYFSTVVSKDSVIGIDSSGFPRFGCITENASSITNSPDTGIRNLMSLNSLVKYSFNRIDVRILVNRLADYWKKFEPEKSVFLFYADIWGISEEDATTIIKTGEYIEPYFETDWKNISQKIAQKAGEQLQKLRETGVRELNFESFDDIAQKKEINPFTSLEKNDMYLLSQCIRPEVRKQLEEEMGISFSEISFRALVSLMRFLSQKTESEYQRLIIILKDNPEDKIKILETFVGCAENISFGDEFLSVCEESRGNELKTFIDIYFGIVADSEKIKELLSIEKKDLEITPEIKNKYTQTAIKKARTILNRWKKDINKAREKDEEFTPNEEQLKEYREQEIQSAIFTSIFQEVRKQYGIKAFEIMGGFEAKSITKLTEEEKTQIEMMYKQNYSETDPELTELLIEVFRKRATREEVTVYLIKDKNKVVSILTTEPIKKEGGPDGIYFGSFNTDTIYQGASIGEAMMQKVVDEYAKSHVIYADCNRNARISSNYIERGFVATKEYPLFSTRSLSIVRNKNTNKLLVSKAMTEKEIVSQTQLNTKVTIGGNIILFSCTKESLPRLSFENELSSGYLITRYFYLNNMVFFVFEKIPEVPIEQTTSPN